MISQYRCYLFSTLPLAMWTVFFMVETSKRPIEECEIVIDQNPEAYVFWRNRFVPPFNQQWAILTRFIHRDYQSAKQCQTRWINKTRGIQRYIAKSFYLARNLFQERPGEVEFQVTPLSLQDHEALFSKYYDTAKLTWPPTPLTQLLEAPPTTNVYVSPTAKEYKLQAEALPAPFQKPKSIADLIRIHDLLKNELKSVPTDVLKKYISVLAQV